MGVSEKVSTTMLWMVRATTVKFTNISNKLLSIKFVKQSNKFFKQNKMGVIACLILWIVINVTGFVICRQNVTNLKDDFYQKGIFATQSLTEKVGPFLLEKDILSLNVAIRDLAKKKNIAFAAILDHKNKVVAHTDPEMTNRPLTSIRNLRPIETIDNVFIETGEGGPDNLQLISFAKDVSFSKVKIGKVYYGMFLTELKNASSRFRMILLSVFLASTIILSAVLFLLGHISRAKAIKIRKELEGITNIGPYLLREKIAEGGMAELFLADYIREDGFRRTVAVKKVLPHLAENQDFINMFIREARLAALLRHPNVIQIIDYGKIKNVYFIAMEYIDGKNLAEIMAEIKGPIPVDLSVFLMLKISTGLHYSHAKIHHETGEPLNIVHRDISPQNIIISYQGEVKISDFGISKARSEPSFTQAGVIKGKLSYLSPEQALGQEVGRQADIYALGLVFYEILSGKKVYQFSDYIEAIRSIPEKEIPPLISVRPDIPDELNRIVMKCLKKDLKLRYQVARDIHDDLISLKNNLKIIYDVHHLENFMKKNCDKTKVSHKKK